MWSLPIAGRENRDLIRPGRAMMRRVLDAACLTFCTSLCLPAPTSSADRSTVRDVVISGARSMPASRVASWLMTRHGMPLDSLLLGQDVERVLAGYQEAGFWQVSVAWPVVRPSVDGVAVTLQIHEGRRTRVRSLVVTGGAATLDSVRFGSSAGAALVTEALGADARLAVSHMETRGYPFASALPQISLAPGQDSVDVVLAVDAGPLVRVDSLGFEGNRVTRDAVLLREIQYLLGTTYDQRLVDRASRRLRRLPFLIWSDDPLIQPVPGGGFALIFPVEETVAARIHGVVGYAPDAGTGARGLTGSFLLDAPNLAGTGRGGKVGWERRGPGATTLRVAYREPWVAGRPVAVGLRASMRQDPGLWEDEAAVFASLALSGDAGLEAGLRHSRIRADDTDVPEFPVGRETGLEAQVWRDRRDSVWNPSRGRLWRVMTTWSRVSREAEEARRFSWALHLDYYSGIGKRSVLAAGMHAAGVTEDGHVPAVSRLRLGGAATIRGYIEEAFLARKAFWSNLEWRMPMGARSRVFLFLDFGRLTIADGPNQDRAIHPVGYGAGLLAESHMGLVGFDYGLSKGDGPGQGRLHLRLASSF